MKLTTTLLVTVLSTTALASPAAVDMTPRDISTRDMAPAAQIEGCGAAGSCAGPGGGDLCNDRCKRCRGETGPYNSGKCCGWLWLSCCCYYG